MPSCRGDSQDEKRFPCGAVEKPTDNTQTRPHNMVDMGRRGKARSHFDAVRTGIGTELRSLYFNVLNEPLPEKIAELLRQLDEQIRQLDRDDDI